MICPKCGSQNVAIQVVNEVKLKNAHHGCLWWLIIGWWWIPIKWIFLTFPALLAKIFKNPDLHTAPDNRSNAYFALFLNTKT